MTYRKHEDEKQAYQRVLKLDPRNTSALSFLGIVHHMLGEIDAAIVKYHEVCSTTYKLERLNRMN